MTEDVALGLGQAKARGGRVQLVGRLAQEDLGGRVGQQSDGDLGRGRAVVGLGAEVGRSVGDADIGHAVGSTELEAGLEVPSGVAVAEQGPRLVDHLHPLWPGPSHELGQPPGSRHHYQGHGLGVDGHGRQVEHDPRPVPPQRNGGAPIEHAPQ